MDPKILLVTKEVKNNIVAEIDRRHYAMFDNQSTDRLDLFNLALAIGLLEDKLTPLSTRESFVRTERLTEDILGRYRAIYYNKIIAPNMLPIDEILNTSNIYDIIEQYANTGFLKIKEYMTQYDDETFILKLLADASEIYRKEFVMDGMVAENEEEYL